MKLPNVDVIHMSWISFRKEILGAGLETALPH